jgi:hypothetical protein
MTKEAYVLHLTHKYTAAPELCPCNVTAYEAWARYCLGHRDIARME